ncbi:MAG: PaaX family transcriptional regulator C-terminal domain-containing protein [Actinomycetota bacterium]
MPSAGLSARSVIASTLLGTHPPEMDGRFLVAFAKRFGIAEGTARVALSRMVDRGELENAGGRYRLAGHLAERQGRQDAARASVSGAWDGRWVQAVAVGTASPTRRATRRSQFAAAKLAELREGVWLRPDNLETDRAALEGPDVVWASMEPAGDPTELANHLWDLEAWATEARALTEGLRASADGLAADDDDLLAPGFVLAAAVLRHFLADPELPEALTPEAWPAAELRGAYDEFDTAYRALTRRFFLAHR